MKKGVTYVEMVISFSIFLIFAFFLLFYLNPAKYQDIKPVLLEILQESIKENSSISFMEFSLVLNPGIPDIQGCFAINFEEIFAKVPEENIRVFDSNKSAINFSIENGKLNISGKGKLYYIYYAEGAFVSNGNGAMLGCKELKKENYTIVSPRIKKIVAKKKLEELEKNYEENYEKTKKALNFPQGFDFLVNISSIDKKPILEMSRKKPEKVEVVASDLFLEILKENGEIEKTILHIEVW